MLLYKLRNKVLDANLELVRQGLVIYTWGNVSEIDRESGLIVIKPSGLNYDVMKPEHMVIVDTNGKKVDGKLNPSSDLDTHLKIYKAFSKVYAIAHTHSKWATVWAQAGKSIPCYGTTQADYFHGEIPVTRKMTESEIKGRYEAETGEVIKECFRNLSYLEYPGVLVNNHGPFSWGKDAYEAVYHAKVMEYVAEMAYGVQGICPGKGPIQTELIDKHYLRKHGKDAYYGQANI